MFSMNHDRIVNEIYLRLNHVQHSNQILGIKEEYLLGDKQGEIDLYELFKVNDRFIAYAIEVKSTDCDKNRSKAESQLEKDVRFLSGLFPSINKIHTFYAYSEGDSYTVERIKTIDYSKIGHYDQDIEDKTCW